jgi:hypothetical protein
VRHRAAGEPALGASDSVRDGREPRREVATRVVTGTEQVEFAVSHGLGGRRGGLVVKAERQPQGGGDAPSARLGVHDELVHQTQHAVRRRLGRARDDTLDEARP